MNDLFDILSLLCVISVAVGFALLVRWGFSFVKTPASRYSSSHKKTRRSIEAFCFFLSFGIIFLSVILIFLPWQIIFANFTQFDYFYYIVLFVIVFAVVCFFRILLPVAICSYALYSLTFVALFMHSYTPSPQNIDVQIVEPSSVVVQSVTISFRSLLPLSRYWISEPSVLVVALVSPEIPARQLFAPTIELFDEDSIFTSLITALASLIIDAGSKIEQTSTLFDSSREFPFQYTAEFFIGKNGIAIKPVLP